MGTRNLSICKHKNAYPIMQYGQWDGYPRGQGKTILEFCQEKSNIEKLKQSLEQLTLVSNYQDYIKRANKLAPVYIGDKDNRPTETIYHYKMLCSRDIGGQIFNNIININHDKMPKEFEGKIPLSMYDDKELSNFCDIWIEYAYIINFDKNTLDCYGHNKLLGSYDLDNLPTVEKFIEELEKNEEE